MIRLQARPKRLTQVLTAPHWEEFLGRFSIRSRARGANKPVVWPVGLKGTSFGVKVMRFGFRDRCSLVRVPRVAFIANTRARFKSTITNAYLVAINHSTLRDCVS